MLGGMLHAAGAGTPTEYLNHGVVFDTIGEYVAHIRENQSGEFVGLKVLYGQLNYHANRFDMTPMDFLYAIMGDEVKCVHLSRQDKVRQAVSVLRAKQTGQWHAKANERIRRPALEFDRVQIDKHVGMFREFDRRWSCILPSPLRITYESMVDNLDSAFQTVAQYIGLEAETPTPKHKKLAGKEVERIVNRYTRG